MASRLPGIHFRNQNAAEEGRVNVGPGHIQSVTFGVGHHGVVIATSIAHGKEDVLITDILEKQANIDILTVL